MAARAEEVTLHLTVKQRQALRDLDKFRQHLGKLTRYAGILGGVLGGIGFAAVAKKALFTAARFDEISLVVDQVAKNMGHNVEYIHQLDQEIQAVGITADVSRTILLRFMQQNLDLGRAAEYAAAAQKAAIPAMMDTSEAALHGIEAIVRLEPRMLRTSGFFVQLEQEYKKIAEATGRSVQDMTTEEKQRIALNAAIRESAKLNGIYEEAMKNVGKQWRSFTGRELKTFLAELGNVAMPAFETLVGWLREVTKETTEWFKANGEILKQRVADWAENLSGKLETLHHWLGQHIDDLIMWAKIIAATAIIVKIGQIAHSITGLVLAIKSVGWAAMGAAGPIGIIVAAIAGLAAGIIYLNRKAKEGQDEIVSLSRRYATLAEKVDKTAAEKQELIDLTEKLRDVLPDSVLGIDAETEALERNREAVVALKDQKVVLLGAEIKSVEAQIIALEEAMQRLPASGAAGDLAPHFRGQAETASEANEKIGKLTVQLAGLQARYEALKDAAQWGAAGPEAMLPGLPIPEIDEGGAAAAVADAWNAVLKTLTAMRIDTIRDQCEKEIAQIQVKYADFQNKIVQNTEITEAQKAEALEVGLGWYLDMLNEADRKRLEQAKKAAEDEAAARIQALRDELDYRRQLQGWSQADYIAALQTELEAYAEGTEERRLLEEALQEAIREGEIQTAEARRDIERAKRDEAKATWQAIERAGIDALTAIITKTQEAHAAWRQFGDWLEQFITRKFIEGLFEGFGDTVKDWGKGASGGFKSFFSSLLPFLGSAEHGMVVRQPGLVMAHPPELISPESMLREIVRQETGAGRGQAVQVIVPIDRIMAYDSASILESVRSGDLGRVIEEAVERGWLKIQMGKT